MCRVILSEFKKVFKSKVNIMILVIFLGFTFFMNTRTYQRDGFTYDGPIVIDGVSYEGNSLHKKFEEEASKLSGKIDEKKNVQLFNEFIAKYEKTKENDEIDTIKMEKSFGSNWKVDYYEKVQNKQMTTDLYFEKYCYKTCEYYEDEQGQPIFPVYYKHDGQRRFLSILYLNRADSGFTSPLTLDELMKNNPESPFYALAHKTENLYEKGKNNSSLFYNVNENDSASVAAAQMLSEKMKENDNVYYSTLANNLFLENIRSSISIFTLLVIAILVANLFANETHFKTDQIIVPTKVGNTKITIAKCICGMGLAVGIIAVQWLLTFIVACIFLPIHDLGGVVMNMFGTYSYVTSYAFTYSEVILKGIFITFICGIATSVVTMSLSYFTRNRFGTIIPMFLVLFIPLLIPIFNIIFKMSALDYLFPARLISFEDLFEAGGMYSGNPHIMIGDEVLSMMTITSIVYMAMMIILLAIMFMHSRKHQVQNR